MGNARIGSPVFLEKVSSLSPTQMAVGYREVGVKRKKLQMGCGAGEHAALQKRLILAIAGPCGRLYIRDGHHLALALHHAGCVAALVRIVADFSDLSIGAFWQRLQARSWAYPFDGNGRQRQFGRMPSNLLDIEDDSFRSLARALRRDGAFAKTSIPYADFAWANFLRRRIDPNLPVQNFSAALALSCGLAGSRAAKHLPGWLQRKTVIDAVPISAQPS